MHQRHGHRFDAHLALLLILARVCVAHATLAATHRVAHGVCLRDQHVQEARLAVVQVPRHADVANQRRSCREALKELWARVAGQRLALKHLEALLLDGGYDGLLKPTSKPG